MAKKYPDRYERTPDYKPPSLDMRRIHERYLQSQLPKHTEQQYRFVMSYLETGDPVRAYKEAGYYDFSDTWTSYRRLGMVQRVLDSKAVQKLMTAIQEQVIEQRGLKLDHLVEQLLRAHSHAKTASEEITAIKEIARLLGYYDKAERKQRVKEFKKKGLTNLSDFELKRLAKGGRTLPMGVIRSESS